MFRRLLPGGGRLHGARIPAGDAAGSARTQPAHADRFSNLFFCRFSSRILSFRHSETQPKIFRLAF